MRGAGAVLDELRERWRTLYDAFDPQKPVTDRAWRAERPYSPASALVEALTTAPRPKRVLLKGTPGNGKTSELWFVADQAAAHRFVVFFDFEQHFRVTMRDDAAMQSAQPWELLFLVGVAVWRAGQELGVSWLPEHKKQLEDAYTALLRRDEPEEVKVDVAAVASSLVLFAGGVAAAASAAALVPLAMATMAPGVQRLASSTRWELPFRIGRRGALDDQDPMVSGLLHAVNALVGHLQLKHRPVLLVIDGLDRLEPDSANRHFVRSGLLAELPCSLVLTVPAGTSRTLTRFDRTMTVDNVPVLDRALPTQVGRGAAFFHDVWRRRAGALTDALTPAQLDRLAWSSGGLLRHFCRLMRGICERMFGAGLPAVPDTILDAVIDEARRELEDGMTREEFQLLRSIVADPDHELPEHPLVADLLREHRLLPYPNDSTWYFPHPLLTLKKVSLTPSPGSASS